MKPHVRRQIVHLALPDAPGVAALAAVVPAQRRGRDADEPMGRDVGAAEERGCGRVGGEVGPVEGGVAGVEEDFFGGGPG